MYCEKCNARLIQYEDLRVHCKTCGSKVEFAGHGLDHDGYWVKLYHCPRCGQVRESNTCMKGDKKTICPYC